jgi:hypothetical protein
MAHFCGRKRLNLQQRTIYQRGALRLSSTQESMMDTRETNISTEHEPKAVALNPGDTLDRENDNVAPGQRQWNADSQQDPDTNRNDTALPAGLADDGAEQEASEGGDD